MINTEGDKLGTVKGLPPKEYTFSQRVLLGCDENIGATVTASRGVALLDICSSLTMHGI